MIPRRHFLATGAALLGLPLAGWWHGVRTISFSTLQTINPNDIELTGGELVLSNGNLTVAHTGLVQQFHGGRALVGAATGAYRIKITIDGYGGQEEIHVGIANASWNYGTLLGTGNANSIAIGMDGGVDINGVTVGSGSAFVQGDYILAEFDLDNDTLQYSVNGGALCAAIDISSRAAGVYFPAFVLSADGDQITFDFATAPVQTAGFTIWPASQNLPAAAHTGTITGVAQIGGEYTSVWTLDDNGGGQYAIDATTGYITTLISPLSTDSITISAGGLTPTPSPLIVLITAT